MLKDVKAGWRQPPGLHSFALGKVTAGFSGNIKEKGFMPTINQLIRKGREPPLVEGARWGERPLTLRESLAMWPLVRGAASSFP